MKEVKKPQKPLIFYYGVVLAALLLFNLLILPWLARRQIQEVDYGTFMTMTEQGELGEVEIQSNQILFTDKDMTASEEAHSIPLPLRESSISVPYFFLLPTRPASLGSCGGPEARQLPDVQYGQVQRQGLCEQL